MMILNYNIRLLQRESLNRVFLFEDFYIAFLALTFCPSKSNKNPVWLSSDSVDGQALERGRFLTLTKAKIPTSVKLALVICVSIYCIPQLGNPLLYLVILQLEQLRLLTDFFQLCPSSTGLSRFIPYFGLLDQNCHATVNHTKSPSDRLATAQTGRFQGRNLFFFFLIQLILKYYAIISLLLE